MKRLAVIVILLAAGTVAVLGTGAGGGGSYKVRAIFDNAVSVIPGEDVKIAGVKVGRIDSLDVTCKEGTNCHGPQKSAAVVLDITDPGFQDFRTDATCTIRPQSLIGEKFVECTPTQPRAVGEPAAKPLPKINKGDGKGQHLLPLTQTSSPVDIDLLNDIMRKPYADRLSIIIDELGTGLAGRGKDLNETIKRADPALQQTDKVLNILANQNRILADLARDSDTVLTPLAEQRERVADQFGKSAQVAQATAERGADLERNFQLFPTFLRQLRPTMQRLGALSDQATPVLSDLHAQAPNINFFIKQLAPFSRASLPALRTLGEAGRIGGPALQRSHPAIKELGRFATATKPVARNAAALLNSLQKTGGVERVMDFLFFTTTAINGFDQLGHYLRAELIINLCTTYATLPTPGCSSKFQSASGASAVNSAATRDQLRANLASLAGNEPATTASRSEDKQDKPIKLPSIALPGRLGDVLSGATKTPAPQTESGQAGDGQQPAAGKQTAEKRSDAQEQTAAAAAPAPDPRQGLLDYLLGSGS